ncbi:RNA polymerase sigma factor [Bradyrhizobium diazoefficiens]|nr:RNA polymerase sigma factor [Bradyrhizobium diazoefficiens]MBR0851608.1 RNA polymerase sigma factor [Bradyrhizobium diazoefficiens]
MTYANAIFADEAIPRPSRRRDRCPATLIRVEACRRSWQMIWVGAAYQVAETISAAIAAEMPKLRRHALSLLYNHADAEDLVQDCLVTALAKQDTLQDSGRLRGWLFAILNNLFLMRMRSGKRRGATIPIDEFAEQLADLAAPTDRDAALDLARAMGKLSMEHRQILLLLNVEGCSYQEISEILDVPVGTVMSRLARARERLRTLLEGGGPRIVEQTR